MRAPDFWRENNLTSALLTPFGMLYDVGGRLRQSLRTPFDPGVPVVCVGNVTAGGSGKTPTALSLATILRGLGFQPAFISRGHGGRLRGPVRIDPARHDHTAVGDEALLLARQASTWIGKNRARAAMPAVEEGANVLIMDDGLQNNSLRKTISLIVVDGGYGFGNQQVIPAGPLREKLARGLARADAFVLIGKAPSDLRGRLRDTGRPVLSARLIPPATAEPIRGQRVFGFAGIGRPEKFANTLQELGADLVGFQGFPDHHNFQPSEVMAIVEAAAALDARVMTTEKDAVRLPLAARQMVQILPIRLQFEEPGDISEILRSAFGDPQAPAVG